MGLYLSPEPVPETPNLDRRRLLGFGALAAGVLLSPGCATTRLRGGRLCLPPVCISPDRIVRTTVGLRPYRDGGFVVRAETLGSKRLVHNYGHGGAGISLSWGSSRLAADLGLPGHNGPVAVIGCGVMGLTTARLAQEEGFAVTIYADRLPPHTTSDVAAGQWLPTGHFDEGSVGAAWHRQYLDAAAYSHRRFRGIRGDRYGVRSVRNYLQAGGSGQAPRSRVEALLPGHHLLGPGEHPFPTPYVRAFDGMIIETPRLLRRLMDEFRSDGGEIVVRRFNSSAAIETLGERLVFNCTGLGSRALFGDAALRPVRGQLVWIEPQRGIDYSWSGAGGYMFPRDDAIILGGTFEHDQWSTQPNPATTASILGYHLRVFGSFDC